VPVARCASSRRAAGFETTMLTAEATDEKQASLERLNCAVAKLPKPYYDDGGGRVIYHGDCRELLPLIEPKLVDLVLTDPPYGIDYRCSQKNCKAHPKVSGDQTKFDPTELIKRFAVLIMWGADNYASTLPRGAWLAWDKVTRNGLQLASSEYEFAWTNCTKRHQGFRHMWKGAFRDSERGTSFHPTQKSNALMKWCIGLIKPLPMIVSDPFLGSGTTLRACKDLGCCGIGIEIEERYCEIAANRLAQGVLF
jgi:site-specific DNA-methyltransferase (adenine-specific)